MRNPLRSEDEAFRFLVVVIVGAGIIIAAAYANTWAGVAAAVLVFAGLAQWLRREPPAGAVEAPGPLASAPPGRPRILVLAPPGTDHVAVPEGAEVLVVVPAAASHEAAATVGALEAGLPDARIEIGAEDPILAVEDAQRVFGADEILVVGDEELLAAIRERVALPVSPA
jgi:hypothetical protein